MEKADWRYERKFNVQFLNRHTLEAWLNQHPAGFKRAFPNRQINNIYYDTPEFNCYAENMAGVNERRKYRVRWYGENIREIQSPRLEVKMKHNELGNKHIEQLEAFTLDQMPDIERISNYVYNSGQTFAPSLLNKYLRSYFLSADGKYRLTVDDHMEFLSPRQALVHAPFWYKLNDVVLELKYSREADNDVSFVTNNLPFRQTKNSKYASGLMLTHF